MTSHFFVLFSLYFEHFFHLIKFYQFLLLHKSLFQKAEEIMDEMGVVDKEHRDMIHQLIRVRFKNKENDENKLRKFIQANSGALE